MQIFRKALEEPQYNSLYAQLCRRLSDFAHDKDVGTSEIVWGIASCEVVFFFADFQTCPIDESSECVYATIYHTWRWVLTWVSQSLHSIIKTPEGAPVRLLDFRSGSSNGFQDDARKQKLEHLSNIKFIGV